MILNILLLFPLDHETVVWHSMSLTSPSYIRCRCTHFYVIMKLVQYVYVHMKFLPVDVRIMYNRKELIQVSHLDSFSQPH